MPRQQWEVRINGLRMSGNVYPSWYTAIRAAITYAEQTYYHAFKEGYDEFGREIGAKIATFHAEYLHAKHRTPRQNLSMTIPLICGQNLSIQINRIPR